jgi:predicted nuclease with TOPRIM domain
MENQNLKARLFDLLDEKSKLNCEIERVKGVAEHIAMELDEVRGELNNARSVAEKRADMVRDLVRENRELKKQLLTPVKPELTDEVIHEVTRILKKHIEPCNTACGEPAPEPDWRF